MRAVCILLLGAFQLACGGDDSNGTPDAADETVLQPDAGLPDTSVAYPAFTIDAPQVANQGGPVLAAPKVQAVFFPGFDYATQLTSFMSKLGASAYWSGLAEYKVGALTAPTPITLTSAQIVPADIGNINDAYIQSWLQARFDGTHPEFGTVPDPAAVYTLFYPTTTVISLGGGGAPDGGGGFGGSKSCSSFGGYHGDVSIKGVSVAYAVMPECPTFGNLAGVDVVTATTSHELAEAATDPFPMSMPAYSQVDANHFAWMSFLGGGEIGDLCAQFPSSFYAPSDVGFMVQRTWSNARATAGKDPCQPADSTTPYFNAMPVFKDPITVHSTSSKGILVPVGQTKPLEVDLFSDTPTTSTWALTAQAYGRSGAAVPITLAFDTASGQNGDKVNLNVTATGALTNSSKTATILVTSSLNGRQNIWLGYVGQ
jgi:hypothetical protein